VVTGGSSAAEVGAPLKRVRAFVQDVERVPQWQGGLTVMRALECDEDRRAVLCQTEADARARAVRSVVQYSYGGPAALAWRQEQGDLQVGCRLVGVGGPAAGHDGGCPDGRTQAGGRIRLMPGEEYPRAAPARRFDVRAMPVPPGHDRWGGERAIGTRRTIAPTQKPHKSVCRRRSTQGTHRHADTPRHVAAQLLKSL
jgi:hypothetical protein